MNQKSINKPAKTHASVLNTAIHHAARFHLLCTVGLQQHLLFHFQDLLDAVRIYPSKTHKTTCGIIKMTWPSMLLGGCCYCSHKPLQMYLATEVVAMTCPNSK